MSNSFMRGDYGNTPEEVTDYLERTSTTWWAKWRQAEQSGDADERREAHEHILVTRLSWAILKAVGKAA